MHLSELKKRYATKQFALTAAGDERIIVDRRSGVSPAECVNRKLFSLLNDRLSAKLISRLPR